MEDILLVHRKSNLKSEAKSISGATVWRTCLRQIVFFDESSFQFTCEQDDQVLRGSEALRFLLEVLTGLHSPVLGETEVLGQFRNFIESRRLLGDPLFSEHRKWLQFLIAEVKKLRADLVCGLGSNSYGGLVRKHSRNFSSVSILGSGHLAQEILPWMIQKSNVQIVSRDPSQVRLPEPKFLKVKIASYSEIEKHSQKLAEVVVVAAPLSDQQIKNLILQKDSRVQLVFDLRAEANQLAEAWQATAVKIYSLEQLFAELAGSKIENEKKIEHIKSVIAKRVGQFMERSELRPMGWDDLCA